MKKNNSLNRRDVISGAAALAASSTIIPAFAGDGPVAALNEIDTFYDTQYTYCDAKLLANYWEGSSEGGAISDAKIRAGQKILDDAHPFLKAELKAAARQWRNEGRACQFTDADNPAYTQKDLSDLARYWNAKNNDKMDSYDAKLKVMLNVSAGGGNSWVISELNYARQ